jgi:hypothetical protein
MAKAKTWGVWSGRRDCPNKGGWIAGSIGLPRADLLRIVRRMTPESGWVYQVREAPAHDVPKREA